MRVSRARISGSMLSRFGARWVTTTKAMPGSDGITLNRCSSASTPPADAPTPTMGKRLSIDLETDLEESVPPVAVAKPRPERREFKDYRAEGSEDGTARDKSFCA